MPTGAPPPLLPPPGVASSYYSELPFEPRKLACQSCHASKVACRGAIDQACARCQRLGTACVPRIAITNFGSDGSKRQRTAAAVSADQGGGGQACTATSSLADGGAGANPAGDPADGTSLAADGGAGASPAAADTGAGASPAGISPTAGMSPAARSSTKSASPAEDGTSPAAGGSGDSTSLAADTRGGGRPVSQGVNSEDFVKDVAQLLAQVADGAEQLDLSEEEGGRQLADEFSEGEDGASVSMIMLWHGGGDTQT